MDKKKIKKLSVDEVLANRIKNAQERGESNEKIRGDLIDYVRMMDKDKLMK